MAGWDFWIDRGGTFTDIVARDPGGRLHRASCSRRIPNATTTRRCTASATSSGSAPDAPIPAARVASVKMGTTVATNALLERKGEPVVLVTTQGLGAAAAARPTRTGRGFSTGRSCCRRCSTPG